MLFNSAVFLLGFMPVTFAGFVLLSMASARAAGVWLTAASFVFYGWWAPQGIPLLACSMTVNYLLGGLLIRRPSRALLIGSVAANLLLLGYYKYTGFAVDVLNQATGAGWPLPQVALPLAISFFTFQQIAYLSDAHDGAVVEHDFLNYCLFITFFPHLIAGPITHHREMLSQFTKPGGFSFRLQTFSIGLTVFLLGLFKKVVVADPFGATASPIFDVAAVGGPVPLLDAWTGALAYAIQIYYDFSGYTDMAIGLGLLFGINLPQNFNSPYKAHNVIEFWSRWHMTLTRFLTAYIYNPLVLSISRRRMAAGLPLPKRGRTTPRMFLQLVALPTLATMFLSGIWHGAGWQFIVFGLLHGAYLVINHGWRASKAHWGWTVDSKRPMRRIPAIAGTFLCVVVALVYFRAANLSAASALISGMFGTAGVALPKSWFAVLHVAQPPWTVPQGTPHFSTVVGVAVAATLLATWILPNVGQWMLPRQIAIAVNLQPAWLPRIVPAIAWRPTAWVGAAVGVVGFCALLRALSVAPTEFLYFKF